MIRKVKICDLCGKEWDQFGNNDFSHYQVREKRFTNWRQIDVHSYCLHQLLSNITPPTGGSSMQDE
jgi:hypothetical protein